MIDSAHLPLLAPLLVPTAYALMWTVEARSPARSYAPVPGWQRLGVAFFVLTATVGSLVPWLLEGSGFTALRVLDLSALGLWGVPVGLLVLTLVHYAWHRAEHRFDLLWRMGHQLHHAAPRVDVPGAYVVHPFEVMVKTSMGVALTTVVLGLAPAAAALTTALLAVLSIFQHWNIHTPRWLGWLVPRPEMHALHHERDVHARNYGDLPVWDMLFGTYANPARFDGQVGFAPHLATRWGDMLRMRDVHKARVDSPGKRGCCGLLSKQ
jgi:sterol desaturase/sphingolipid hydroxylase (fatty acid hydroxylase superfamily)